MESPVFLFMFFLANNSFCHFRKIMSRMGSVAAGKDKSANVVPKSAKSRRCFVRFYA